MPKISNIKVATDEKIEEDIIHLAKEGIGIIDDVEIWNQMMRTITRFNICNNNNNK